MQRQVLSLLVPVSLALGGCAALSSSTSVSDSATGLSDSVSGLSNSVSGSLGSLSRSSAGDDDSAQSEYREDVRVATRAFLESERGEAALLRELGSIATLHGISHWEARAETLVGIGAGAQQAGLSETELDALLGRLGQPGPDPRALAQRGWLAAAP